MRTKKSEGALMMERRNMMIMETDKLMQRKKTPDCSVGAGKGHRGGKSAVRRGGGGASVDDSIESGCDQRQSDSRKLTPSTRPKHHRRMAATPTDVLSRLPTSSVPGAASRNRHHSKRSSLSGVDARHHRRSSAGVNGRAIGASERESLPPRYQRHHHAVREDYGRHYHRPPLYRRANAVAAAAAAKNDFDAESSSDNEEDDKDVDDGPANGTSSLQMTEKPRHRLTKKYAMATSLTNAGSYSAMRHGGGKHRDHSALSR